MGRRMFPVWAYGTAALAVFFVRPGWVSVALAVTHLFALTLIRRLARERREASDALDRLIWNNHMRHQTFFAISGDTGLTQSEVRKRFEAHGDRSWEVELRDG